MTAANIREQADRDAPRSAPAAVALFAGGGEMGRRMREFNWAQHSLGAPLRWPQSLKTIVRVMLDSRYAMWMLWGPELTFFCNDAYLPTVGIKGDWVLGARSDKVWEEIWPDIGPRIRQVLERGQSTWDEGLLLFLERRGFPEETYHTFSYSPVYDDGGRIAGMLCVVTEVTERILAERRLQTLRERSRGLSGRSRTSRAWSMTCWTFRPSPRGASNYAARRCSCTNWSRARSRRLTRSCSKSGTNSRSSQVAARC